MIGLNGRHYLRYLHRDDLWDWLGDRPDGGLDSVIHLGACIDTPEDGVARLLRLNTDYSRYLWRVCVRDGVSLVWVQRSDLRRRLAGVLEPEGYPGGPGGAGAAEPCGLSKHCFDVWVVWGTAPVGRAPSASSWRSSTGPRAELRERYRHFTEAETAKLQEDGAPDWTPLEEGVERYMRWLEECDGAR